MSGYYRDYKGITIRDRWRLEGEIGAGGFGQVYLATDLKTNKFVAVKLCYLKANPGKSSLQHESVFYKALQNQPGIATLHDIGSDDRQSIEFMVCDLLGASLWDLLGRCGHRFSLKTTLMLTDQLISRVEMLHLKNVIHRDLKMENIVMGFGKENGKTAYLLDFGLSGYFRSRDDYITAPDYRLAGTIETACIAWHLNRPQSPKDDLESLAYVLIFLFRGYLPWSIDGDSDASFPSSERALRMKLSLPIDIICKDMPSEFARHLKYVRSLKYNDAPNYSKLRDMYQRLMKRMGYEYDGVYDWDLTEEEIDSTKQSRSDDIPASIQDQSLEQENHVAQSKALIQDTPFVQDKPLAQDSPLAQGKTLKRKKVEENIEDDQQDTQGQATQPAKKRKPILTKTVTDKDQDQPATKRRGRQPKVQTKDASTKNAQNEATATEKDAENNESAGNNVLKGKKPAARKGARK
ncbi:casein kinase I isoform delta [Trichoderma asperellum]|uniref:non-specific serine/threonine protein kinase n=1 Tax=Trichoderma asperellum TaxID=101201 RepID=A0A6V8QLK6_TRIAP|nr:casein kinase I isoform delta [Trichoderma asperellum]